MRTSLQEDINTYGGKHGGLLHLRENAEGGKDNILPLEILDPSQGFTRQTKQRVWAACKDMGAEKVIIRASEQSDWKGMVDTMPTVVCPRSSWRIKNVIKLIRAQCHDPELCQYADREGLGYDPENITISVTPFIQDSFSNPLVLVTQHPNIDDLHLIDVSWPPREGSGANSYHHQSLDYKDGHLSYAYVGDNMQRHGEKALELVRQIEAQGMLPSTEAFQFECGISGADQSAKIYQIRHFANRHTAEYSLDGLPRNYRSFGVTPPEGVEHAVLNTLHRGEYKSFEAQNPGVSYLFNVDNISGPLSLSDQPTDMKGYRPDFAPALSHQNTRYTQMCLRDPHGTVSLCTPVSFHQFRTGQRVRIYANGTTQIIEAIG